MGVMAVAIGYAGLALVGKSMAFVGNNVSPIWPASGFALVAVWRGGPWFAVGVMLGSMAVNHDRMGALAATLVGVGSALETLVARLLLRSARVRPELDRVRDVLTFAISGGVIATAVSGVIGASVICGLVAATPPSWFAVLWTWWSGDLIGVLIVAPVLLMATQWSPVTTWRQATELAVLTLLIVGASWVVFGLPLELGGNLSPLGYLCFPPLIWAALRFGAPGAAFATLAVSAIAVVMTVRGYGPFAGFVDLNNRLLALQTFLIASAVTAQVMAAVFAHKQAALSALRESEERYRLISDHTRDLVTLHALDGRFRWASPSALPLLGWNPEYLVGRDPYTFYHPDDVGLVRNRGHQPLLDDSPGILIEYRFRHQDGRWIWLESSAQLVRDSAGQPLAIQSISRDITQRKIDEARLDQARQTNLHADRMAALGTLAGGVAHEFNNLNAIVLGNCELLLRSSTLPIEVTRRIGQIRTAADRSAAITRGLLDYARDRGPEHGRCDAVEAVRSTLDLAERTLSQRGVRTVIQLPKEPIPVAATTGALGQIVLNLVLNAADAVDGRQDGTITVALDVDGEYLRVSIADNGIGIPEEHLSRLFLPFFTTKGPTARGDFAQQHLPGTGLGLSVCDTLVRNLHGRIEVRSELGTGTTFTVRLPLATAADPSPHAPPTNRSARILIIDDEDDLRAIVVDQLRQAGHIVRDCPEGFAGLALLRVEDVDLVLLDMHMPGLDGLGVLQRIAADPHRTWPPVLILSGSDDGHVPQPLPPQVVGVLHKPLRYDDLLRAVRDSLR